MSKSDKKSNIMDEYEGEKYIATPDNAMEIVAK